MMRLYKLHVSELLNGDIILFENTRLISRLVQIITRSKFSHAAMYFNNQVYESTQDGFNPVSVEHSLKHSKYYVVQRLVHEVNDNKLECAINSLIGTKYNFKDTIVSQPLHQIVGGWIGDKVFKNRANCSQIIAYILNTMYDIYNDWYKTSPDELFENRIDFKTFELIK